MEFPSIEDLREQINRRNYAQVPFALSRRELVGAAEAYMRFLALPLKAKERFHFKLNFDDGDSDIGYMCPDPNQGKDSKEYFHYHPLAQRRFKNLPYSSRSSVRDFFEKAADIFAAAEDTLDHVLAEFNKDVRGKGIRSRFMVRHSPRRFYLRFLKYDAKGMGKFLARAHFDRGGCTLAIAESAPGLRLGWNNSERGPILEEVVHKENTAVFFPSYHFPMLMGADFEPAWHDVIQSSEDQYSADTARWAIVFFADVYGLPLPSEEACHTPWPKSPVHA